MSRPPVIGICGRARSGKDTAADFLVAQIGGYRYAFADPIREMIKVGIGVDMADPYWKSKKEEIIPALGKSPRQMMQTLGTEWGRDMVNKDLWLILAKRQLQFNGPGMIITDVRFQNEATWVYQMGGHMLRIERPPFHTKGLTPVQDHSSETTLDDFVCTCTVDNTGSLEDLQRSIGAYVTHFI